MTRKSRRQQGVTLIELLIVLSILVVIASLGLPSIMRMVERSRLTSAAKELQAELNRTRLESMKSGEPLAFHYQPGTGNYEIMAKQEYDLRYPVAGRTAPFSSQQFSQPFPSNMGMGTMPPGMTGDFDQPPQAAGSTGPSLTDRGSTSLTDLVAGQSRSLSDTAAGATSFADYGPPPSLTDHFGEPDMQLIAAIPVSKFLPVQKELPYNFEFQGVGSRGQGAEFGLQNSDFGFSPPIPYSLSPSPSSWSEPIFFFPNGRTSNAHFTVCSTDGIGFSIDVTVRGLTGTARLGDMEAVR